MLFPYPRRAQIIIQSIVGAEHRSALMSTFRTTHVERRNCRKSCPALSHNTRSTTTAFDLREFSHVVSTSTFNL